jgi:hypothetical protein
MSGSKVFSLARPKESVLLSYLLETSFKNALKIANLQKNIQDLTLLTPPLDFCPFQVSATKKKQERRRKRH